MLQCLAASQKVSQQGWNECSIVLAAADVADNIDHIYKLVLHKNG